MKWPGQETMRRAIEGFLGGLIHAIVGAIAEVFIDMFLASLFVLSTATMAISSLACLTFGSPAAAMVFGIALLSITLAARSHSWGRKLFDPEVMDLIVAGEVAYLVLIKQGFTIFNCFVIISSLAMAYLLPYR